MLGTVCCIFFSNHKLCCLIYIGILYDIYKIYICRGEVDIKFYHFAQFALPRTQAYQWSGHHCCQLDIYCSSWSSLNSQSKDFDQMFNLIISCSTWISWRAPVKSSSSSFHFLTFLLSNSWLSFGFSKNGFINIPFRRHLCWQGWELSLFKISYVPCWVVFLCWTVQTKSAAVKSASLQLFAENINPFNIQSIYVFFQPSLTLIKNREIEKKSIDLIFLYSTDR